MEYKVLADRVHYFKRDQKGVMTMCKAMEDMRKEERMETSIETAKRMLNDGLLSCEKIAEYTGLSLDEVVAVNHPDLRLDALEAGACKSSN